MAKQVLGPDTSVTVNGTDLSQWVTNVTVEDSAEEVDVTGFSETYREFETGLKDTTITCTFLQDYSAGGPDVGPQPCHRPQPAALFARRASGRCRTAGYAIPD